MMKTITTSKASYHTLATENIVEPLMVTDYKDPPIVLKIGGVNLDKDIPQ